MKKRHVVVSALALHAFTSAFAGLYIGPSVFWQRTTANHTTYKNYHPRMSLGYAATFGSFYLAGEANATPFSKEISNTHTDGAANLKTSRQIGASVLPGYMLTDSTVAYARLGLDSTRFSSANTTKTGTDLGLGVKTAIGTNWDIRCEYIHTKFRSASSLDNPKSDSVGLGFLYNFS